MKEIESPMPNARAFALGSCKVLVSRHEIKERGIIVLRWHLSISHQTRYPTWEEIKEARYALLPDDVTMAMLLPPKGEYVNLHNNCFHLHEIDNEE
jgi:hypothetical protein